MNNGSTHTIAASETGYAVELRNFQVEATGTGNDAINLSGNGAKYMIENVRVRGSDGNGIYLNVREGILADCIVDGFGDGVTDNDLVVDDVRNVVNGCYFNGDVQITSNATDCVLTGVFIRGSLTDNGTRTVVNGRSTNNGDPSSTGQWNGNATLAHELGVTVWDTSTDPDTPYKAGPDGNWTSI